jgi:hypothetical protein
MYCLDNGQPSIPPSLLSGVLLLQFDADASDAEAIARLNFDLRWKVALRLGLDFDPPHASSLSIFRSRLLENGQERYAFDRLLAVERKIADLVGHGLRRAHYLGRTKVRLQSHWIGAVVNLKRLFQLLQGNTGQMRQALAPPWQPRDRWRVS